ncbi:hypothetical protein HaLaN_11661 [Haematococcus lacustris]|uniref:Uncharacterized protein n=1 Tax=Haematococcus lacustris TaxID=44745 RepID=A0A699YYR9_HAELA|nr:hypothetical protein HaLaN_11661 [Haematococcus lacustris]
MVERQSIMVERQRIIVERQSALFDNGRAAIDNGRAAKVGESVGQRDIRCWSTGDGGGYGIGEPQIY